MGFSPALTLMLNMFAEDAKCVATLRGNSGQVLVHGGATAEGFETSDLEAQLDGMLNQASSIASRVLSLEADESLVRCISNMRRIAAVPADEAIHLKLLRVLETLEDLKTRCDAALEAHLVSQKSKHFTDYDEMYTLLS